MKHLGRTIIARLMSLFLAAMLVATSIASTANARFISPDDWDPVKPGVGTNRYAYSENDPVNKSDPNGHVLFVAPAVAACAGGGCEAIISGIAGVIVGTGIGVGIFANPFARKDQRASISGNVFGQTGTTGSDVVDGVLNDLGGFSGLPGGISATPNFEAPGADLPGVLQGLEDAGVDLDLVDPVKGVYQGDLPDGRTVTVRPGSTTDGRPNIDVFRPNQAKPNKQRKISETRLGPKPKTESPEEKDKGRDHSDNASSEVE